MTWPRKPSALFILSAVSMYLFQGCQCVHEVVAGGLVSKNLHCRQMLYHWATREPLGRALHYNKEKESEVAQLCPTLCDPMGCSPPGSSAHGILQARVWNGFSLLTCSLSATHLWGLSLKSSKTSLSLRITPLIIFLILFSLVFFQKVLR